MYTCVNLNVRSKILVIVGVELLANIYLAVPTLLVCRKETTLTTSTNFNIRYS